ncbi:flagellar motor stator protein MotA [Sansalvadorimonas sp. 2012CJ34-2]|uniref:Flagellar motor stator protein MotA n=1 Tax=Parendozoicomonas callyspongiae TaxID=2942213 RepID=A0ABT0PH56_9GAMM|nr:flagellar motor stator protein MotA [Sansalvadorimonas sp. 2012CJ34-2]MCL6270082.1 flagellar motor stator protein MotA [Sansalvadorimonas sp. 2012CJ34-2]
MLKITGLAILIFSVLGGFVLADGQLLSLWQPAQILIIAGGGIGAFLIANPWHVVCHTMRHLGKAIRGTNHYPAEYYQNLLTLLFKLFEVRRQAGVTALEAHIEEPENSILFMDSGILENERLTAFICDNLRLVTLGKVLPHELEGLLDHELTTMADDLHRPADALQRIADSLPGFGIVAAVLGIVLTMQSMDGPAYLLGMNVAAALVGTFLGILLCYGLISPLAQSVTHSVRDEIQLYECVKASLLAKVSGRPSAIAADAGRRILYSEIRPSFIQLEAWLAESRE